jgi:hypothetical protein
VRPPLAPVHTGVGKTTPQPPLCARPDYEGGTSPPWSARSISR